jgi:hypothetical protein
MGKGVKISKKSKKQIEKDTELYNSNKVKVLKIQKPNENIEINIAPEEETKTKFNPQAFLVDLFNQFSEREESAENSRFRSVDQKINNIENFVNKLAETLEITFKRISEKQDK